METGMADWLSTLARPPASSLREGDLSDLLAHWEALEGSPLTRAVAAAVVADRLGLAFAAGYRSALLAMTGEAGHAALCITEQGGAHPRAIETRLERRGDELALTGTKAWATLAGSARTLLVAASIGREGDRNELRMVRVPVDAKGVRVEAVPATPFTPEIPHSRVTFDAVAVPSSAVLEGDGYTRWIKPFRTVEDIHVMAAAAAYVVGEGRRARWPAMVIAEGIAVIAGLAGLAERDPLDPAVHLALGGALAGFTGWLERTRPRWASMGVEVRQRWERDRPILGVAGKARAARFEKAAIAVGLTASEPEGS
jgi:acyl-CoA dehydrogenase